MRSAWVPVVVAVLVLLGAVDASDAQVFFGAEPRASLTIGPLFVVGTASPDIGAMTVTVAWNVVPASGRPVAQDLHLFWPAEVASATAAGAADAELVRYVEARGFAPTGSGRLVVRSRNRAQLGLPGPADPVGVTASYVSFVRTAAPTQAGAGSLVRIPWTAQLGDPRFVLNLALPLRGVVGPKPATWLEELFWGRRNVVT